MSYVRPTQPRTPEQPGTYCHEYSQDEIEKWKRDFNDINFNDTEYWDEQVEKGEARTTMRKKCYAFAVVSAALFITAIILMAVRFDSRDELLQDNPNQHDLVFQTIDTTLYVPDLTEDTVAHPLDNDDDDDLEVDDSEGSSGDDNFEDDDDDAASVDNGGEDGEEFGTETAWVTSSRFESTETELQSRNIDPESKDETGGDEEGGSDRLRK